jgi:hypothetical protein
VRAPSVLHLAVAAVAAACSSAPAPLELPAATIAIGYAPVGDAAVATSSPQSLHIEVLALREAPAGEAVDLAAVAIARESGAPFRGASSLTPGSRWLAGGAADEWLARRAQLASSELQVLGEGEVVLADGLRAEIATAIPGVPALRLLRMPAGGGVAVTLHVPATPITPVEDVIVGEPLGDGKCALLFVPTSSRDFAGHALLLQPAPPPSPTAVAAAGARVHIGPPAPERWPVPWQTVFAAVGGNSRRPALLAIARPLFAERCVEVLLDADELALIDITAALADVDLGRDDVAWQFERAMWRALVPRLERDELPRALHSAFLRNFGALADDSASLGLLLTTSNDGEAMCAGTRDANVDALGDRDAAMRVRAHDWLRYKGVAVLDYSPLAPANERRAALRAYSERRRTAEAPR